MLLAIQIPYTMGYNSPNTNAGEMLTHGYDIDVSSARSYCVISSTVLVLSSLTICLSILFEQLRHYFWWKS